MNDLLALQKMAKGVERMKPVIVNQIAAFMDNPTYQAIQQARILSEPFAAKIASYKPPMDNPTYQAIQQARILSEPFAAKIASYKPPITLPDIIGNSVSHFNRMVDTTASTNGIIIPTLSSNMMSAIEAIKRHQSRFEGIFESINNMTAISTSLSQIHKLHHTFVTVGNQLIEDYSSTETLDGIKTFEDVNVELANWSDRVARNEYITKEEFFEFQSMIFSKIETITKTLIHIKSNPITHIVTWISIVGFALSIYWQYAEKAEPVSIPYFESFRTQLLQAVEEKLEQKEYRPLTRKCKIHLKPNFKSEMLTQLDSGYNIIVLEIQQGWACISYSDPKDGLTQSGWVQEKYLDNKTF